MVNSPKKPVVKLTGTDGNVFAIIGAVKKALRKARQEEQSKSFVVAAFKSSSYDVVLQLAMDYCDVR